MLDAVKRDLVLTGTTRLTFVTIAFSGEILNLLLQAKSLKIFGGNIVRHWIIVWNEPKARASKSQAHIDLIAKELADAAFTYEIVWRADLIDFDEPAGSGHRMQQLLKLYVAERVFTSVYFLLDTKNHLVRSFETIHILEQGKPLAYQQSYREGDLFHHSFENARSIFDAPLANTSSFKALPSTTPYVMYTQAVRSMLLELRLRLGKGWYERILIKKEDNSNTTEFALYNGYLEAQSCVNELYTLGTNKYSLALFALSPKTETECLKLISQVIHDESIKFFGIHKARFARLTTSEKTTIIRLWTECNLFQTESKANSFLSEASQS